MPCIVVLITLGYLAVIHLASFIKDGTLWDWQDGALDQAFLEASANEVRKPVSMLRARMGLDANDVVVRDGELYYRPDIAHVTGRNFMRDEEGSSHVVLNKDGREERVSDPLPAILDFHCQLQERGIRLILLPVPSKAHFAGPHYDPNLNQGYWPLLFELGGPGGVEVLNLVPHYQNERVNFGRKLFLQTDSHWDPPTMELSANLLASGIRNRSSDTEEFSTSRRTVTNSGDLAELLGEDWSEAIEQKVVLDGQGKAWKPAVDSPVLLLGDSFTNVFSLTEMGWGSGAGLAEALSVELGFSVDRIARNADGAFASREELQRSPGRLQGKQVVIWQFAMRELSLGDWKVLEMPAEDRPERPAIPAKTAEVEGVIERVATVPPLTRAPYRQAVLEVLLKDVRREGELPERVVLLGFGVDDREPTPMTTWKVGQRVKARIVPWEEVESRLGRLHRFALKDPELELLELPWVWRAE